MTPKASRSEIAEVRVDAPAKLNLMLRILGRREDGFHELDSVFHAIDICDEIRLRRRPSRGVELCCEGEIEVPAGESNLAHRAATLFLECFAPRAGVAIDLVKRIPHGSGLGGGSSDAAAVIKGLCRLLAISPGSTELNELAARLGSDVPFFLSGGSARCRGRGERVDRISSDRQFVFVVLVVPLVVSTAAVYKNYDGILTRDPAGSSLDEEVARLFVRKDIGPFLWNDLERSAFELFPSLERIRTAFQEMARPRRVLLTGSGCGLFCPCLTDEEASVIASRLRSNGLGRVFEATSWLART